jgi:hypothetical protein
MDFPGRSLAARWTILVIMTACLSSCGAPPSTTLRTYPRDLGSFSMSHGPAVIHEGEFSGQASIRPWSGYWHPLSRIDARSALEKYDRLSGKEALAREEQRIRSEARPFLPWEGRCDAWAIASILQPEPLVPKVVEVEGRREVFSVAEQKALWIYAHEVVDPSIRGTVGERNDGNGGSSFEDISPAEFHRVLQVMLQDRRVPFIMDRDPRPPVWNTPVDGARWTIRRDPERADVFHVRAWVYAVFPYDDDRDSTERLAPVLEYQYVLEAHPVPDGYEVHGAKWSGRSVRDHPDFVTWVEPGASSSVRSLNVDLDSDWLRARFQ